MAYKIDWLAFSVRLDEGLLYAEKLMTSLGYDLTEFDEVPGRFFYNSGATFKGYVNVYWNDPDKKRLKRSSDTMAVVFTGQGATDLANKWSSDWIAIFKLLKKERANITRIDLALDDYDGLVSFDRIEGKLKRGHYRSSRRSFNVLQSSDAKGRELGRTIYIGNARADGGSKGNVYARFYDKRAQYLAKNELFPTAVQKHWQETGQEVWQRYEISFSKKYAVAIAGQILQGQGVDKIFKTSLRGLLELLKPNPRDSNKSRWAVCDWWEEFLSFDEALTFKIAEREAMLGDLFEWLRVAVLPSLALLEHLGQERGFDIFELLKQAQKPGEAGFSKKQKRLLEHAKGLPDEAVNRYLKNFLKGRGLDG